MLLDGVAGRGNLVVLSGEAGAGKTRLAEEAAAFATTAGVAVAWATCWSNGAAPLSTWLDLQSMVDEPGTPPVSEPASYEADPEAARAILVRTLVARLRMAIGARPTLVVDDLQWCDPLSLHAIEVLVGSLRASPIGLVATFREDGDPSVTRLDALTRAGRHLIVPPLTEAELAELAVEVTGRALSSSAVAHLRDRSAGNVLFARELLAGSEREGVDDCAVAGHVTSHALAMFAGRLAGLSSSCQQMLLAASMIGRRFCARFSRRPEGCTNRVARPSRTASLVLARGGVVPAVQPPIHDPRCASSPSFTARESDLIADWPASRSSRGTELRRGIREWLDDGYRGARCVPMLSEPTRRFHGSTLVVTSRCVRSQGSSARRR